LLVGELDGLAVGLTVRIEVGFEDGESVINALGTTEDIPVGLVVGTIDNIEVGKLVSALVGFTDGIELGLETDKLITSSLFS